jgi:CubicO group peptidase (beta-lactamase class C family)
MSSSRNCRAVDIEQDRPAGTQNSIAQSENGVVVHPFDSDIMRGSPPPRDKLVTRGNYESKHSFQVWALQHMQDLCPTQLVSRGSAQVAILRRKPVDVNNMQIRDLDGNPMNVRQFLKRTYTDAFLVLHKGRIVTEQYFSGMRPDTPHRIYSAGKSVLADLVAILMEEGKLGENVPICSYIPELEKGPYAGATLRHLLDMQSGVKYEYDLKSAHDSMTEQGRHFRAANIFRKLPGEDPDAGQYEFFLSLNEATRDHGMIFSYKCCDTNVLAWVCERVTGSRYVDLVSTRIWSKLGPEHSASIICDAQGAATPNGGMSTTLRDLARWGQMHLAGGMFRDRRIVPKGFIDDIVHNANPTKITEDSFPPPDYLTPGWAYRSQFWLPEGKDGPYCAWGGYGQYCYIHPVSEVVIVKFSTHKGFDVDLGKLEILAFHQISESLGI